jgi:hypothetical protein
MNFPTPEQASIIRKAKAVLEKNVNERLSIFGPYEKRLFNWYVSGGCIASLLRGEEPNDYDIYFSSRETMDHVVALVTGSPDLKAHILDVEEKYREVMGKDGKCITENAITMKNGLQFITKHCGAPDTVRNTFDFVHCMPMYSFDSKRLYISEEQYQCCVNKVLIVNEQKNVTQQRIDKFIKLGYREQVKRTVTTIEDDDFLAKLFGEKK